jgi:hypothetical protein
VAHATAFAYNYCLEASAGRAATMADQPLPGVYQIGEV